MKYRHYSVRSNVRSSSPRSFATALAAINNNQEKIVHVIHTGEFSIEIITLGQDN